MILCTGQFAAFGVSHWVVLAAALGGSVGVVALGRTTTPQVARAVALGLAGAMVTLNLGTQVWSLREGPLTQHLPLQLSDLAPYVCGYALWARRRWAFSLTYFWCLTLSTQALLTPALVSPDFPDIQFVTFFALHVLPLWGAVYLTWGLGIVPDWRSYWWTLGATILWAAPTEMVNVLAGVNYGFLNGKPATASILDLLGPWPWYVLQQALLICVVWAAMTVVWPARRRHHAER